MQAFFKISLPDTLENITDIEELISALKTLTGKNDLVEIISYIVPDDLRTALTFDQKKDLIQIIFDNPDRAFKNIYEVSNVYTLMRTFTKGLLEAFQLHSHLMETIGIEGLVTMVNDAHELDVALGFIAQNSFTCGKNQNALLGAIGCPRIITMIGDDSNKLYRILSMVDSTPQANLIQAIGGVKHISTKINNPIELINFLKSLNKELRSALIQEMGFVRINELIHEYDDLENILAHLNFDQITACLQTMGDRIDTLITTNFSQLMDFLTCVITEHKNSYFETQGFERIAAITTNFDQLMKLLGLLNPKQKSDYLLEIEKIGDNHLSNLFTTFDELIKFFEVLSPIQQGTILLSIDVKKIAALIKTYSHVSFLLKTLDEIQSQYLQPLLSSENAPKPLRSIIIERINHTIRKENYPRIQQLKTALANELAIDAIASTIKSASELIDFLGFLSADQQRICLQIIDKLGSHEIIFKKWSEECEVDSCFATNLLGAIKTLPLNLLPDFFKILAKNDVDYFAKFKALFLFSHHLSSDKERLVILTQQFGKRIGTIAEFIDCLQQPPQITYSSSHIIFNFYELFFAALHLRPEDKNDFRQMFKKRKSIIFACKCSELCETLESLNPPQRSKCLEVIGIIHFRSITQTQKAGVENKISVLNSLSSPENSCIEECKLIIRMGSIFYEELLPFYERVVSVTVKKEILSFHYPYLITDDKKYEELYQQIQTPQDKNLFEKFKNHKILTLNRNKYLKILADEKHPLHNSYRWDDSVGIFLNLNVLFKPSAMNPETPRLQLIRNKLFHTADCPTTQIEPILSYLKEQLQAIDEETILLPPNDSIRFIGVESSPETSHIALLLQFAIEKLQALLAPQQTLEQQNSSSSRMQLTA
jgi:hypothetical protein